MKFSAFTPRSLGEVGRFIQNSKFKIFLLFLFSIFYFLFSAIPSFAQTPVTQTNPYTTTNTDPNVPKNLHTWTQNVMLEVVSAMSCELGGVDPTNPNQPCLGVDQKTGKIGFVPNGGGAVGVMGSLIAMTFTPPIHTGDYFNYLSQNFGITKHAYADNGIGFTGLSPLVGLWSAFRNIVYLLFVIVFVTIGLAIMLRVKIDPRTVMSIENQIPKIIIGILLVTFSFAIAGFLVDMMYVTIYLTYGTISNVPGVDVSQYAPSNLQNETPLEAVGGLGGVNGIANNVALNTETVVKNAIGLDNSWFGVGINLDDVLHISGGSVSFVPPKFETPNISFHPEKILSFDPLHMSFMSFLVNLISIGSGIGAGLGFAKGINIPALGLLPGVAVGAITVPLVQLTLRQLLPWLIPYLIIMIAIIWALFRLWFQLIMAYVFILIDVVLAPFWIGIGLFPGVSIGFGAWLRDIIANLSAFPVTIAMFLMGKVFIDAFTTNSSSMFVPPLVGSINGTGGGPSPLGSLIGLGIILMTPQVVTMMRDYLKAPQFKYTAAIGQAVGVGAATTTNIPRGAIGLRQASKEHYISKVELGPGGQQQITYAPRGIIGAVFGRFGK